MKGVVIAVTFAFLVWLFPALFPAQFRSIYDSALKSLNPAQNVKANVTAPQVVSIKSSIFCDDTKYFFTDRDTTCVVRFIGIDVSKLLKEVKASVVADWYNETQDAYEEISSFTWNNFETQGGFFDGRFTATISTKVRDNGFLGLGSQEIPKDGTYRQVRVLPRYYYTDGTMDTAEEISIPVKY